MTRQAGFSLIEMVVSLAIISVIASLGFSAYKVAQRKNEVISANNAIVTYLRRAQILSQAVDTDSQWGLRIQNNTAIIFKGTSYATSDRTTSEVYTLPGALTYSGLNEVVFSKLYGYPATTGSITITGSNNATSTITINAKGTISY